MDAGLGKQTGDIVSSKRSSQDEYFRYKLLEAKLKNASDSNADPLLKVQSEREAIEITILRNLVSITESSPEFAQIVDITGSRDRYEQARILSEVVYDKVRAEQILGFYTPNRESLEKHFSNRTARAYETRKEGKALMTSALNSSSGALSAASGFGKLLQSVTGGAAPNNG